MGFSQKLLFTFFLCSSFLLLFGIEVVESSNSHHHGHGHGHHHHHHGHHHHVKGGGLEKLFVFGDSYADTGNNRNPIGSSWKEPYGVTFPGKPSGRFSDGRVFTDYLARHLGLRSPTPYAFRKYKPNHNIKYGINFAFGGTGVFDTTAPYPNMTTQIDFFEQIIKDSVITPYDLQNSIVHVSLVGNDYSAYLARGGSISGLQTFIPQVVNQLAINVERINKLRVKKISVTALQPLGCLPTSTGDNSFQQCNDIYNQAVAFHNLLLQQALSKLNNETTKDNGAPPIVTIDLYNAFFSIFQQKETQQGSSKFDNLMEPCCSGINQNYSCGSVDENGNKMYKVCQDPKSFFFWDQVHPTQAGWEALTVALQDNLHEIQR